MYILCADPPLDGMGLTIFWFLRVRYGTNPRNVSKKTASDVYIIYAVHLQKI